MTIIYEPNCNTTTDATVNTLKWAMSTTKKKNKN